MVTQKDGTAFPGWYRLLSAFLKGCYNFLALLTLGAFRILEGSCQLRNSCHSATGGWLGLHGSTCSCVEGTTWHHLKGTPKMQTTRNFGFTTHILMIAVGLHEMTSCRSCVDSRGRRPGWFGICSRHPTAFPSVAVVGIQTFCIFFADMDDSPL